jgi:DNA-binding MltR family transcriptional regulator
MTDSPDDIAKSALSIVEKALGLTLTMAKSQEHAHASTAILASAIIEDRLRKTILTKMQRISGNLEARLFDGYGPLGSFSAKIDFAYALDLLSERIFDDLKTIKDIRNEFAHPEETEGGLKYQDLKFVTFSSPQILRHLKRFPSYDEKDIQRQIFFLARLQEIAEYLDVIIARSGLIRGPADGNPALEP